MKRTKVVGAVGFLLMGVVGAVPVQAHNTGIHDNCTNFNRKYPHGAGRRGAVDQGGNVTNFLRSNWRYNRAESHNGDLDRETTASPARRHRRGSQG